MNTIEKEIRGIVGMILDDYDKGRAIDEVENVFNQLDKAVIKDVLEKLLRIIYPGYYHDKAYKLYDVKSALTVLIEDVTYNLNKQIMIVLQYQPENVGKTQEELREQAEQISIAFFQKIPQIRARVAEDVQACYDGDPAAYSKAEVIFSYPGLHAITVNRIAHELWLLGVPMIPRIMTEQAHSETGIDIHPGATIGRFFFIDHGTGIVIGETTRIGNNVKVYQGVTLGALSTRGGQSLRGKKRHPTIEDNVTIYAGASILGGDTVIGHDAVIGSNVFITQSVPAGAKIVVKNQELEYL